MDAALNWLWQGCIVAIASSALLRVLERARANVRYIVCWAALFLVLALPVFPGLGTAAMRPDVAGLATADAIVSVPDRWWTSSAAMLAAWLAWAAVYTVRVGRALIALRRARASSQPFPPLVESALRHWPRVRRTGRCPALVLSHTVPTAAVLGCGPPLVAVAPALLTRLDSGELDRVLIHEWAHVQRRDDLLNILQVVVRIVAGWHPAVWWIERRLQLEREIACDEMTVAITHSPKSYAECLVKLATLRTAELTALAGPALLTATDLRVRITRIVSRHAFIAPAWSRGLGLGIVSILCAVSGVVGGLSLVEVTAFALPFESVPVVDGGPRELAPVALPSLASPRPSPLRRVPRRSSPASSTQRQGPQDRAPAGATPADKEQRASEVALPLEPGTSPPPATDTHVDTENAPAPSTGVPATRSGEVAVEPVRAPWMKAADAGTALGRKSKDAGLATAGIFTRLAHRAAGF